MAYQFDYRIYRRPFRLPLHTHHGVWRAREGIIVRLLQADGWTGFGEIAPLPEFGSESLGEAIAFCQNLPSQISRADIASIPAALPACQFGLESIVATWPGEAYDPPETAVCHLLPTGGPALEAWMGPWKRGYRTFKWKIGVASLESELAILDALMRQLPGSARLRLDANGGLTWEAANRYLERCDRLSASQPATIEFLEQPLPVPAFADLLRLSRAYKTPIALDESVATLGQLQACYEQGWRGVVVIKAAIAGFPSKLREFCQNHEIDIVWSSVFETAIARQYLFNHLIPSIHRPTRALGFGVGQWFVDSELDCDDVEHIWQHL